MATKILLVEDNADNLLVLAICLQIEGFTGSEAFQKLEDETFDVVVSDIRMPGLIGFDLVGRIPERFAGVRIVLITADPRARRMATDNQAGVSSVLIKPFPIKELVRAIREAVPETDVKSVGRASHLIHTINYPSLISLYRYSITAACSCSPPSGSDNAASLSCLNAHSAIRLDRPDVISASRTHLVTYQRSSLWRKMSQTILGRRR